LYGYFRGYLSKRIKISPSGYAIYLPLRLQTVVSGRLRIATGVRSTPAVGPVQRALGNVARQPYPISLVS